MTKTKKDEQIRSTIFTDKYWSRGTYIQWTRLAKWKANYFAIVYYIFCVHFFSLYKIMHIRVICSSDRITTHFQNLLVVVVFFISLNACIFHFSFLFRLSSRIFWVFSIHFSLLCVQMVKEPTDLKIINGRWKQIHKLA